MSSQVLTMRFVRPKQLTQACGGEAKMAFVCLKGTAYLAAASIRPYVNAVAMNPALAAEVGSPRAALVFALSRTPLEFSTLGS